MKTYDSTEFLLERLIHSDQGPHSFSFFELKTFLIKDLFYNFTRPIVKSLLYF